MIASGGAGELEHLVEALRAGADAVLCASIFHYGRFTIAEAKAHLAAAGIPVRDAAGVAALSRRAPGARRRRGARASGGPPRRAGAARAGAHARGHRARRRRRARPAARGTAARARRDRRARTPPGSPTRSPRRSRRASGPTASPSSGPCTSASGPRRSRGSTAASTSPSGAPRATPRPARCPRCGRAARGGPAPARLHRQRDRGAAARQPEAQGLIAVEHALEDLRAGRLRVLHERSFLDDPTRLLRLARYARPARLRGRAADRASSREARSPAARSQTVSRRPPRRRAAPRRGRARPRSAPSRGSTPWACSIALGLPIPFDARARARPQPGCCRADGSRSVLAARVLPSARPRRRRRRARGGRGADRGAHRRRLHAHGSSKRRSGALRWTRARGPARRAPAQSCASLLGERPLEAVALAGALAARTGQAAEASAGRWLAELRHVTPRDRRARPARRGRAAGPGDRRAASPRRSTARSTASSRPGARRSSQRGAGGRRVSAPRPAIRAARRAAALFTDRSAGNLSSVGGDGAEHGEAARERLRALLGVSGSRAATRCTATTCAAVLARPSRDPAGHDGLAAGRRPGDRARGRRRRWCSAPTACRSRSARRARSRCSTPAGAASPPACSRRASRPLAQLAPDGPLAAVIGPCAGPCCYEVGDEVHEALAQRRPGPGRDRSTCRAHRPRAAARGRRGRRARAWRLHDLRRALLLPPPRRRARRAPGGGRVVELISGLDPARVRANLERIRSARSTRAARRPRLDGARPVEILAAVQVRARRGAARARRGRDRAGRREPRAGPRAQGGRPRRAVRVGLHRPAPEQARAPDRAARAPDPLGRLRVGAARARAPPRARAPRAADPDRGQRRRRAGQGGDRARRARRLHRRARRCPSRG